MRVLDLFSGVGGFSLGLERAGMRTVAFCEIDHYCRAVLAKHWPHVPCYEDIRTLTAAKLAADGIAVDVICGGFPCQDISCAGQRVGMDGARSGLWSEYARIIGELRPRFVIVENVAALLFDGMGRVLGDLAALGYDAEWHCIPASAVGAPHRRDRLWIVAYPAGGWCEPQQSPSDNQQRCASKRQKRLGPGAGNRSNSGSSSQGIADASGASAEVAKAMADAISAGLEGRSVIGGYIAEQLATIERGNPLLADTHRERQLQSQGLQPYLWRRASDCRWWLTEPDVGRVAHGVPARVDRLRALGNAVVPQIPEIIGRAIMNLEHP